MRASRRTPWAVWPISFIFAFSIALTPAADAAPTNAQIEGKQAEAASARERLDELSADLEEHTEEYFAAEDALEQTKSLIRQSEEDLRLARMDLDRSELKLNERAASIYRHGRVDVVAVFLGVSSFQDFVTRLDLLERIGNNDAALVARVKDARGRLETVHAALENRKAEQLVLAKDAESKYLSMQRAVDEQERFIASIDVELERLIAEERERQQRLARERAAEAARRSAMLAASKGGRQFDPAALGAGHPEVVSLARSFVGKTPYVWGGTTPRGFDCSGLVLYCYRQLGIGLPRTSRQQYRVGAFIPPDRLDLLVPGDLVFFGRDGDPDRVHHVAIYAGGGDMVHAPQRGEDVSVDSLEARIESRGDYVGAVRLP